MSEHLQPKSPEQTSETPIPRLDTDAVRSEIHTLLDDSDVKRYETEPLPFPAVIEDVREHLTWKDFDQDETGEYVFLYRGLDRVDADHMWDNAHQTFAATSKKSREEVFSYYGTTDIVRICELATLAVVPDKNNSHPWPGNPVLHTTRNKILAEGLGSDGVLVTYKIPKKWLVNPKNYPVQGNMGEQELDFFMEIPQEFVHTIDQKRPIQEPIHMRIPQQSSVPTANDIIDVGNLPPPEDSPMLP
jgi:hypothetical protein